MSHHIKTQHRNEKGFLKVSSVMIPNSRAKHWLCMICGEESRSSALIASHVELDHTFEDQKKFALVSVSDIQRLIAKNY